ncbi:MAG: carboxypeptidase-like regulatory domain-containing protein [Patescibacteria group bacterium]
MTFIDVVVGVSLMLLVFLSIFAAYQLAIELVYSTKAKAGGMSLVTQQLEYVRGLPYEEIGTVGGIPAGTIPQVATTSINNIQYTVRTLVLYTDAPEDGLGGADTTGITADYKTIKVEASWAVRSSPRSTFALTRVSPHGVESLTSGGTLRIEVFDALAAPLQGASVHIQNDVLVPTIDVTVESDASGTVLVPGAPAAANYQIEVTRGGYSSARTYAATTENPNPNPGHLAVANQQTTTASFFIDRTGTLRFYTYTPIAGGFFSDDFDGEDKLAATTSVAAISGALSLVADEAGYVASGEAYSMSVAPPLLSAWDTLSWDAEAPSGTTLAVQLYYLSGAEYALVPDALVSGNSAGLTSESVSIATLATSTFPSLRIKALLTGDTTLTPTLDTWRIDYEAGPSPLPNIGIDIHGDKSIGNAVGGEPIYAYDDSFSTNQYGEWVLEDMEWDAYAVQLSDTLYDIASQCPYPLSLAPGSDTSVSLMLNSHTSHSLRVVVAGSGVALSGATVAIAGPAAEEGTTDSCGQVFFSGLSVGTYTLTVTASGFQPSTQETSVAGRTVTPIALSP